MSRLSIREVASIEPIAITSRTRGSAVLWKLFVAFEMRAGQPERAKKLLVRAVGECPLVKGEQHAG